MNDFLKDVQHVIEFTDMGNDRTSWECDCGRAGSAADWKVEEAAEKHIPDGERRAYRSPGGRH